MLTARLAEGLRFYFDEDVDHSEQVARGLRARGVDVLTTVEAGRAGQELSDPDQLRYATEQGRVLVTQDRHFAPSRPHAGIVVIQRALGIGQYITYLELLAHVYSADELANVVHFYE